MKLQLEQKPLASALAKVAGIIEKKNTLPIIANVLLRADDTTLTIIGTDLDIEVVTTIECATSEPGEVTVNAALFSDIVKKTPPGKEISLSLDDHNLTVTAGRSRFKLATLPSDDFPRLGSDEFAATFEMPAPELGRLFGKAAFAILTEEARYYLNGVYLHSVDGEVVSVATDGHRLAKVTYDQSVDFPGVIVPRKTVSEARKILIIGSVIVSVSETKIRLDMGDTVITSKVIDGTFPDYTRVIPSGYDNSVTIDAKDLSRAADRVASMVEDRSKIVNVSVEDGSLSMRATGSMGSAEDTIDATVTGDVITFGINSLYLRDTLSQADGGDVVIEYGNSGQPVLMKTKEDDGFLGVIMPARV